MAIQKPTSLPTWAKDSSVVEPSLGKKAIGWLSGERIAAGMLNWLQRNVSDWIQWLVVGSARTLPWQQTVVIPGAEGAHRAIAVLQSTTTVGVMVLLETTGEGWQLRQCNPLTSDWTDTALAGGATGADFSAGGLAANADRFVLVGAAGRIQTFDHGDVGWTQQNPAAGFGGNFHDVIWDGTQFVAIGDNFEVQTSTNGTSWVRRASTAPVGGPAPMTSFAVIANGGSRLVRGGVNSAGNASLWYSDDGGTTWVHAHTSVETGTFARIIGTIALDGTPIFAAQYDVAHRFAGSTGGITWVEVPQLDSFLYPVTCAYGDLLLAGLGVFLSADGVTWAPLPFSTTAEGVIWDAAFSPQGWGIVSRASSGGEREIARTPIQRWF